MTSLLLSAALALALAGDPSEGAATFERLKKLEGRWEGPTMTQDGPTGAVVFDVIGGGTAVRERMFPDTPHEMMNVYHLDGEELVVTHYCHGNQPRFRQDRAASKDGVVVLQFDGGANIDPAKTGHMHAARLRLLGEDRLDEEWDFQKDGRVVDTKKFFLSRKR